MLWTGTNVYANSFEFYPKYQQDVWTEKAGLPDDSLTDLLANAGSPIPNSVPPTLTDGGNIVVELAIHTSVPWQISRFTRRHTG